MIERSAQGIYIITTVDRHPAKVGISCDLKSRLSQLQGGNWERLYAVEFAFVVSNKWRDRPKNAFAGLDGAALQLETAVHRKMRELEVSLIGEWADCTADDAWGVVRKVADEIGVEIVGVEILQRLQIQVALPQALLHVFEMMLASEQSAREVLNDGRIACGYLTETA
jgi:hypothetical protein